MRELDDNSARIWHWNQSNENFRGKGLYRLVVKAKDNKKECWDEKEEEYINIQ